MNTAAEIRDNKEQAGGKDTCTCKVKVAIIGTGNIGTDILLKLQRFEILECGMFAGRNPDSKGMQIAKKLGIPCSTESIKAIENDPDCCDIVIDATSASVHKRNAPILKQLGKFAIDLTPAKVGKMCIPVLNLEECLDCDNVNLITCGGQATRDALIHFTGIENKLKMDCKAFFIGMLHALEDTQAGDYSEWVAQCNLWKEKYPVVQPEYGETSPVNSYYFVDKLSKLADPEAAIMIDTGACFHVACQTWKVKKGQKFLTTGGLSSMGYWAACLGACVANDRKETIVVTGDGSLQMNIQEFAPIKHNNMPIKVFVLNNNGYLLVRHTQRNFMEDRFVGESPATGVWCPDSLRIAEAYGIKGVRISCPEEAEEKIKEVLAYDGPVVCEVMTPEWQLLIPRISSEKLPDGTLISHDYDDMFLFLSREEVESNRLTH